MSLVSLTPREQETLKLISEGWDNHEIANIMGIGVKSVENYVNSLYHIFPAMPGKHKRTSLLLLAQHYTVGC